MKHYIETNEWHPVYSLLDEKYHSSEEVMYATEVDMPVEVAARIEAAHKEFEACQKILRTMIDAAEGGE